MWSYRNGVKGGEAQIFDHEGEWGRYRGDEEPTLRHQQPSG